jgi:hypothetical protein
MHIPDQTFELRRKNVEALYRSLRPVKCPYFDGEEVHFNSEGIEHVLLKTWNRARTRDEQYARLRFIPHIANVIGNSGTLQEYTERNEFVRKQSGGHWTKVMRLVRYYAFIAIIDDLRMTVVIKDDSGARKRFHSVFPTWDTEPDGRGGRRKKFYSGNPALD